MKKLGERIICIVFLLASIWAVIHIITRLFGE